ncbi:MAG: hypothetical protein GEU74_02855 [Nitriliruptorales bacterium]|nr:hypothetical protein [Nitriliruptorales bacterium]
MSRHLLVIGAQRCGTTYLYRVLDEHPEIAMARPMRPEPKFFLDRNQWTRGIEWYVQTYFGGRDSAVLGEKATSYLEFPEAAQRAGAMLPSAHIIVVLRDPVSRAVSNWKLSTASGLEDRPLQVALTENLQGPSRWEATKTSVSPFAYLERGRYVDYLPPWLDRFGDRVQIYFTDELFDAAGPSMIYNAVGVDALYRPDVLGRRVNAAEHPAGTLDTALLEELRAYFSDSDRRLTEVLGRPLPWAS